MGKEYFLKTRKSKEEPKTNQEKQNSLMLDIYSKIVAEKIRSDFCKLIGDQFRFNKDLEMKEVLFNVKVVPYNETQDKYNVIFISVRLLAMTASEFLELNGIPYDSTL